ncbi:MAG: NADH:ubiquinone reductase (Na(+)-transporting) subunit C [Marinilabiliales bacterium]|nr:MAG: NADH:ubiquinone reductase (Na(+)-transporting) subunit C [Marinilabiliales bacterium]
MKQGNTYIFLYSSAMVVIVAAVLSVVATVLRPYQELNIEIAKKLDILRSVEKAEQAQEVRDRNSYVEEEYDRYIVDSYVISHLGERRDDIDAFGVNMREEMRKPLEERNLPVFVAQDDDGSEYYIFPVHGRGLWGPVYGYVALMGDMNTIFGVIFDHDSETPGLGAEINTPRFESQFKGKKLFDETGEFVSIRINKPGAVPPGDHNVDGISGGTITSQGVEEMLYDVLGSYRTYFRNQKNSEI